LQGWDAVEMLHIAVDGLVELLIGETCSASLENVVFRTWTSPSVLPT
jgi:hypothetical protein